MAAHIPGPSGARRRRQHMHEPTSALPQPWTRGRFDRVNASPADAPIACPQCGRHNPAAAAHPDARMCTGCAVTFWAQREADYAANTYTGSGVPGQLRHVPGLPSVLLTAPNAVHYWRGLKQRRVSRWTGSGAEALAAATGVSALCAFGPPRQIPFRDSPEYAFADRLATLAGPGSFVLDILGMRDRDVDVCLGMGPAPDVRSEATAAYIQRALTARGLRVSINDPFAALQPICVTAYAQTTLGASALQVELAAWLRDPNASPTMSKLVLDALAGALAGAA